MGRRLATIRDANAAKPCADAVTRQRGFFRSAAAFAFLLLQLCSPILRAQAGQPGVITSLVGPQELNDPNVSGASLIRPTGVAIDGAGNIYTADPYNCVVWKTQYGTTTVFAGELPGSLDAPCTSGSATTSPTSTPLAYPVAVAQCNGNVFVAAEGIDPFWLSGVPAEVGGTVDEVGTSGNLSTLQLPPPPSGVGLHPVAIACDASGNVYVSSYFNPAGGGGIVGNVTEFSPTSTGWTTSPFVAPPSGDVYPAIAINPTTGDLDGILATGAVEGWLGSPNLLAGMIWDITKNASGLASNNNFINASALAIDPNGNFYVAQATSNTLPSTYVDFVPASTGTATPIAGNGTEGYVGYGTLSTQAEVYGVTGIALDSTNSLIYLADSNNDVVRRIHSLLPGPSGLTAVPTSVPQSSSATYGSLQGALNPATGDFYYVTGANSVNVINTGSGYICSGCSRIVATIPVGANNGGSTSTLTMAVDATRNRVYVSNTADGDLYVIDGSTYTVVGSVNLNNPNASLLAVDTGTEEVYAGGPNATNVSAVGDALAPNGSTPQLIGNYGYPVNSLSVNAATHVVYAVADSGAGAAVPGEAFITMTPDPSTGALAVSAVTFPLEFAETLNATPGFIANSIAADPVSGSLFVSGVASTDGDDEYYVHDFDQLPTVAAYTQDLDYGWPPMTTALDILNRVFYITDFDGNVNDASSHAEMVTRIDGEAAASTYPGSTAIPVFGAGTPTSPHVYDAEPDSSTYQAWISASDASGGFVSLWDSDSLAVKASTVPNPSMGGGHLFVNPGAQNAYLLDHVNGQLWLVNTPQWTTTLPPTLTQAVNLLSVTINAADSGDSVYYTLDGTAPGLGSAPCSPLPCMVPVTTGKYTTINAIEVSLTTGAASNVVRGVFTMPAPTSLQVSLSPIPADTGATLTLTATITPTTGVSPVTGIVNFTAMSPGAVGSVPITCGQSGTQVNVVSNSGSWQAVCNFVEAAPGSYIFTANYYGDPLNQPSTNTATEQVNPGTTPVLGSVLNVSGDVLAINLNYPPTGSAYALNSYNAVLYSNSSVDLLLGSVLTSVICPPFTAPGSSASLVVSSGAVYVDYANNIIYLAMLNGSALYAAYESIDLTTGVCTQGPLLNLTSTSAPLGSMQMSVDPVQRNMYVMNYRGAFNDSLYIVPTAPWSSLPTPTKDTLDYSVQYGPIVIDPSTHYVYINDLGGSTAGTVGTYATSGFWVYGPNATPPLQHVVSYTNSSGTTTQFYVGTLLTDGAGTLVLVGSNPNANCSSTTSCSNVNCLNANNTCSNGSFYGQGRPPITLIDTNQQGFSFSNLSNPGTVSTIAPTSPDTYTAISGADIDAADRLVYAFAFDSSPLASSGALLEYNLAAGALQPETVLSPSSGTPMPMVGSSAPWSRLNYNPESTELALSASPTESGALGITSQLCLATLPPYLSLMQVAPNAANPSSPGYPSVNPTTGYLYAIDSNSGSIDFVAPPPGCSSTPTYTIGGSVSGLASGTSVTLLDNGGNPVTVTYPATSFTFSTALDSGASYSVTVGAQPTGESCSVSGGSGTVASSNISNVSVTCSALSSGPAQVTDNETITVTDTETFPDVVDSEPISVIDLVTVTVTSPLIITTASPLPTAIEGVPYSTTLAASGGSGTGYMWSITSGGSALSNVGLTLNTATGTISGTPNATETAAAFTVQVEDSALNMYSAPFSLTIGPPAPIANLSTTLLVFAPQANGTTSPAQTVTLSNTGSAPLSITGTMGISISGTNAADFAQTSSSCSTPIAAGSSCAISVTFTPSLSSGAETATLNVADNASGTPQQVGLTGTALAPASVSCTIPTINVPGNSQITCVATDFTGTIALECNLPTTPSQFSNYTCSFSPSSLVFSSSVTQASTTLTIQAVQQSASLERRPRPGYVSSGAVALGAVLWLPGWAFVLRRRKGRAGRGLLLLPILLCGLSMITSCIGKSGPPKPPPGTYQASVTLTGPGLNETIHFTIQVP